jgi:hypothetical protein
VGIVGDIAVPDADVHELLLTELWGFGPMRDPSWKPPTPTPSPFARRRADAQLTIFSGVHVFRSLQGLDDALRASGYGPFPASVPSLDALLSFSIRRWRFDLLWSYEWMAASSNTSDARIRAELVGGSAEAGYDFLRWGHLTGFATVGISGATLAMDARGVNWNYLGDRASALGNPTSIERNAGFLALQVGFDEFLPLDAPGEVGLIFGVRGGYTQQFGLGSWLAGDQGGSVSDRSGLDLGGTWLRFGFGIGWANVLY